MLRIPKKIGIFLIFAPIIIIAAVFLIEKNKEKTTEYTNYSVLAEIPTEKNITCHRGDGRIYICRQNGTRAYDTDGGLVFDISYSFDTPYVVSDGMTAAITEQNGKKVYVVTENGMAISYETEYEINSLCVAQNGTTAVLMQNGLKDIIRIYSAAGEITAEIGTSSTRDGIPVGISLSPDGKKLVTQYVFYDGDDIGTKITFYNTGNIGKNYIENIVGQRKINDIAYRAVFLDENTIGIFFEKKAVIYKMDEIPELLKEVDLGETYNLFPGDTVVTAKSEESGFGIKIYDTNFNILSEITEISNFDEIIPYETEIIIKEDTSFLIYRTNGTKKFEVTLPEDTKDVFYGKNLRYFVVGGDSVKVIGLVD